MEFREVAGQEEVKGAMLRMLREGRVPHAMLLLGPEGNGGLPLSLVFATSLTCRESLDGQPCGHCPSCIKMRKLIHPDVHFVFPVTNSGSSNAISDRYVSDWRNFVLENPYLTLEEWMDHMGVKNRQGGIFAGESDEILKKVWMKPFEASSKVVIIWRADKLNISASNKLLKLFEEPPENTLFILLAKDSGQMLPTILSRMQTLVLPPVEEDALSDFLVRQREISSEEALRAAELSSGDVSRALSFIHNREESGLFYNYFVRWMRLCWSVRSPNKQKQQESMLGIIRLVEELAGLGREKIKQFLLYSLRLIRENLLLHSGQNNLLRMDEAEHEFSLKFSTFIHKDNVFPIVGELTKAYEHIEANGNEKIVMTDLVLKLTRLIR